MSGREGGDKPSFSPTTEVTPTTTASNSTPPTDAKTTLPLAVPNSGSGSSSGLSRGVQIGIGVAIPILFLLIGGGLFLYLKRRRRRKNEGGEVGEVMIIGGKHGHLDEDQSSGPSGPAGFVHPGPPPQASDGHMYTPPAMQNPSGYAQNTAGAPIVAPVASRSPVDEEEFMHRPVSPVHDLLTEDVRGTSVHTGGPSGAALGESIRERGSPTLDDDREMQWILEEERKAKERREQQGRLPHGSSSSMGA